MFLGVTAAERLPIAMRSSPAADQSDNDVHAGLLRHVVVSGFWSI